MQRQTNVLYIITAVAAIAAVVSMTTAIQPRYLMAQLTNTATQSNQLTTTASLNGVNLSFTPTFDPVSGLTKMIMKVTDEKTGMPLTHVDWLLKLLLHPRMRYSKVLQFIPTLVLCS